MVDDIPWLSIRALSFDIYGTLVDQNKGIASAAKATSIGPFLPADDNEFCKDFARYTAEWEMKHPTMLKSDLNCEALRAYASDLQIVEQGKLTQQKVDAAAKEFGGNWGSFPGFNDTVEAMHKLSKRYKLIALSNIDRSSLKGTLANGLGGDPFDACYIAEDIGSYKPDPRNFEYLLQHLKEEFGVDKANLCHIAQSIYHDHPATKRAGIRSVWIDRYDILGSSGRSAEDMQAEYGYKLRARSLGEVADIVEEAFQRAS